MPTGRKGSIHLFRFAGVDLFLHWSWFLVAAYEINSRARTYSSLTWNILEFLTLFLIIMLHEFGHALACRQVGGRADQIILWPLGGIAYVNPPPRPGATLWSIAAGPLVNVTLLPILTLLYLFGGRLDWAHTLPNFYPWLWTIWKINLGLLIFNMLPIYPLDGGQILRSLLWFLIGRARSLMAAAILGLVGVAGLIVLAVVYRDGWTGVLCVFILMNCWGGFQHARVLLRREKLPRRAGFACPSCNAAPPIGDHWTCSQCGQPFDTFQSQAVCPYCRAQYPQTQCLDCGNPHPLPSWAIDAALTPQKL